jgi:glucose-1-phosphate cytidylyltransferase
MKVVLFCGGMGMRLREYSESIPKPMVPIGQRPILWHIMKYYAHFGHKDFILCLGWKANVIKDYFLNYDECASNDFVLSSGGTRVELLNSDIDDWNITFVDTGITASIGQRLRAVRKHLEGEEMFLANYADGLCDLHLPDLVDFHERRGAIASFLSVRPEMTFHMVTLSESGDVRKIQAAKQADVWSNGGFFVMNQAIFDYMQEGEELVLEPFERLIQAGRLVSLKHRGFWGCMDTYKEKQRLDELYERGNPPWEVWRGDAADAPAPRLAPVRTARNGNGQSGNIAGR